jgi:CRISPR-associated protein (TIGR03984 family)
MTHWIQPYPVDDTFTKQPESWLLDAAKSKDLKYLVLFTDDCVLWGIRQEDGKMVYSEDGKLQDLATHGVNKLQQFFIFGENGQIHVWNDSGKLFGNLIEEPASSPERKDEVYPVYVDKVNYLWGSPVEKGQPDQLPFTILSEDPRGFKLKIPLAVKAGHQAGLQVRHYLAEDEDGQVYVAFSRLVGLTEIME